MVVAVGGCKFDVIGDDVIMSAIIIIDVLRLVIISGVMLVVNINMTLI